MPVVPRGHDGFATLPMPGANAWRLAEQGEWRQGDTARLPAGGPYRVAYRTADGIRVQGPLLVGDLWVLAGQSNMQGMGLLHGAINGEERLRCFTLAGRWQQAQDPLHDWWDAREAAYWPGGQPSAMVAGQRRQYARTSGAGLGLPFARAMFEKTGVPVGLIPCALSGTTIAEWSPARDRERSLYGALLKRAKAAGGRVAGVLWYQGEADGKPALAAAYRSQFRALIAALRHDLNRQDLPIYFVQIGRHVHDTQESLNREAWNLVQESQRQVELELPRVSMAASVDLEMDDGIHLGTDGLEALGRRLALLASGAAQPGPRPLRARAEDRRVRLQLGSVNGRLESAGRLAGFTAADATGRITPRIYRVTIDGHDLLLPYDNGPTPPAYLWYGYGKDPYCNVRDSLGMALPVFGPLLVERS